MNPKRPLALALYAVLTTPAEAANGYVQAGYVQPGYVQGDDEASPLVDEAGQPVPVYEHGPREAGNDAYVLLSQYTAIEDPARACRANRMAWRCTVLADVLTRFATEAQASTDPGDLLTEQVQDRARTLLGASLVEGYTVNSVAVDITNGFSEDGADAVWLHNQTRFVFLIS